MTDIKWELGPVGYPPDTVLTHAQVAAALQVSERTLDRLDLPFIPIGPRLKRYVWKVVIDALIKRAA